MEDRHLYGRREGQMYQKDRNTNFGGEDSICEKRRTNIYVKRTKDIHIFVSMKGQSCI